MVDVNELLAEQLDFLKANEKEASMASDLTQDLFTQQVKGHRKTAAAHRMSGKDNALVGRTKDEGQLAAETSSRNFAEQWGVMSTAASYRGKEMAERYWENVDAGMRKSDEIQALQSINFLDAPLEYIKAQFSMNDHIDEYNSYVDEANLASDAMNNAIGTTSANAQTQQQIKQSVTAASIAASARLQIAESERLAQAAENQAIGTDIIGVQAWMNSNKTIMDIRNKAFDATIQIQEMELRADDLEATKKRLASEKIRMDMVIAELGKGKETKETLEAAYKRAYAQYDKAHPAGVDLVEYVDSLRKSNDPQLAQEGNAMVIAANGIMTKVDAVYGRTPSETLSNIQSINPALFEGPKKKWLDFYKQAQLKAQDGLITKNKGAIDPDALAASIDSNIRDAHRTWNKNAEAPGSLFRMPRLVDMAEAKELQSNGFWMKHLQPISDKREYVEVSQVMDLAITEVAAKPELLQKVAEDVSAIYRKAMERNNIESSGVGAPVQSGYVVEGIDYTKPSHVSQFLLKKYHSQKVLQNWSSIMIGGAPLVR